ncbi:conserved repeat domain-containing protein [Desulfatibacillum alkenivorans DSM 16219]|jgi:uncharacterized repeat protein (TIGR01451 family)|uniref:Conserved repeat domain-containing protein n=1 Tax=Desulfatibacillum alkenivorans DSM 16219 TaxID=1121393 RepID=A0A1M6LT53_9BACT|nr:DUF11 domain-containing protein [Desulfatibacillum alkenivorans]SHJ74335.1 conserved repeat domain-containing protein [Desulfatibacillum alkenivorans DSM 16219]
MKRLAIAAMAIFAVITLTTGAWAVGTGAGATISNTASVSWDVGPGSFTGNSNTDTITVDELINVDVVQTDANNIPVEMGDTLAVTTYTVTNIGNGTEQFNLTALSAITDGDDDFNPSHRFIYLETNGSAGYQATDTQYTGPAQVELDADEVMTVYLLNDIPSTGLSDGDLGKVRLTAYSDTTGAVASAGDHYAGQGSNGAADAVAGVTAGRDNDEWFYEVVAVQIAVVKASSVDDGYGGSAAIPGAVITYSLAVTATGSGDATNVVLEDSIPAGTEYVTGSLQLDGGAPAGTDFTDASDSDGADYDSGVVTFTLNDITDLDTYNTADGTHTFTFQVTIIDTGVTP